MTDAPENTPVLEQNTPGEKLNDLLISLQVQSRYIEELLTSVKSGSRDVEDFALRFDMYCHSFAEKLKGIKSLTEEVFKEGYSLIPVDGFKKKWDTISPDINKVKLTDDSVEVVE